MAKKILVMGGTGAMGVYLVPELVNNGYEVDITTRSDERPDSKSIKYIQGDARNLDFIEKTLSKVRYDAVIDFMTYTTDEFRGVHQTLLSATDHYLFLSSYRVFADTEVINERSPRLLDTVKDEEYLATDEYALAKARQEDILRDSNRKNWTIIRPAITYSKTRFQLGVMEADVFVWRAIRGYPVVMPKEMLGKSTTMTWAGDVARMIAGLVLNEKAYCEDFNVATAKNYKWSEVAAFYNKIIGLKLKTCSTAEYIDIMGGGFRRYQVNYDRMFNRAIDNSKVLKTTGIKQDDLIDLYGGLKNELSDFIKAPVFSGVDYIKQAKMDRVARFRIDTDTLTSDERAAYLAINPTVANRLRKKFRIRTRARTLTSWLGPKIRALDVRKYKGHKRAREYDGAMLTLSGYFNYGNIAQRYALQEFLRQKGYSFISYDNNIDNISESDKNKFKHTKDFVDRYIVRKEFDENDELPAYIVGSDQVWRNWDMPKDRGDIKYYFLDFLKKNTAKRISYAASFGLDTLEGANIDSELKDELTPLIMRFDAISVREESALGVIESEWGIKSAVQVLDPTMLLTKSQYAKLIDSANAPLERERGVFAYLLAATDNKQKIVKKIAKQTNESIEEFYPKKIDILPPVEQWLKGFRDSKLIVTDSFHGTVFSIINNTPFIVIENQYGGVARMTSLLDVFGLGDRLVSENDVDTVNHEDLKPIDWQVINNRLDELRKGSGDWLIAALGGDGGR